MLPNFPTTLPKSPNTIQTRFTLRTLFRSINTNLRSTMPHSKVKRERVSKHLQKIIDHLEKLKAQHEESLPKAKIIRHSKVSLKELRANYTPQHKQLPPEVLSNVHKFRRIKSDTNRP